MGGEFIEIRITHPWEFIQPAPEAVRPRLLDWQVDAKGRHVAWRYRITRYEQDGQPRWWLDGTGQHPWTSDDVEYLKDVAEHHAGRLLRRQRRIRPLIDSQLPRRNRALCRFDAHACCTLLIGKGAMTLDAVKTRERNRR